MSQPPVERRLHDRTWLVALAAAMWGTDGLLRMPLATSLPSATVVLWEHLIIAALLSPFLPRALRALSACGVRDRLAVIGIGVGASALATALFTAAFQAGDPVTPLILQKLQPVFAAVAAFLLLGERVRAWYFAFALPAFVGAWLLAFPDPLGLAAARWQPVLLTLGAAVLWASGTVLGRLLSRRLAPRDVTTLRFTVGLPAAGLVVWMQGAPVAVGWGNVPGLLLLALIPGLSALWLYYLGLRATPASRATLAELSFPATAAIIGVGVLGATLSVSQWIGFAVVIASVAALSWHERVRQQQVVWVPSCMRAGRW